MCRATIKVRGQRHPLDAPQVQEITAPDQGSARLVWAGYAASIQSSSLIGSSAMATAEHREPVSREVHARFWEHGGVKSIADATDEGVPPRAAGAGQPPASGLAEAPQRAGVGFALRDLPLAGVPEATPLSTLAECRVGPKDFSSHSFRIAE